MNEDARKLLQGAIDGTLSVLARLPVTPAPDARDRGPASDRYLASFDPVVPGEDGDAARRFDNAHFSMGRSFYHLGALGIAEQAEKALAKAETENQRLNLVGISRVWRAFAEFLGRRAEGEPDPSIRENLRYLSVNPPATFQQAVQLFYFCWCLRGLNRCCCIGRLDYQLRSHYLEDIAAGRLTQEQAGEIILELWAKLNLWGSGDTLMNVMVGGMEPDGSDSSTDLSRIMLEVSALTERRYAMTEPHINLRWHKNLRPDVLEAALKLQYLGGGQATIYNDEALIPEMLRQEIPTKIACDYANDGCTEIIWDSHGRIDFHHVDAVGALELTLFDGQFAPVDYKQPVGYFSAEHVPRIVNADVEPGFHAGDAEKCESFEEFYELYWRQYSYQLHIKLDIVAELNRTACACEIPGLPFLNGTYDQLLEKGGSCIENDLPLNSYMVFTGSIPTAADGLAALKQVVFENKDCTLAQVKQAILDNYSPEGVLGIQAQVIRAKLLNAPKFGNDDDRVDAIAADLTERICDYVEAYSREAGFAVWPALVGWKFVEEAYGTAASPDGRCYGEPIAEHYCATPGRAKNGVTALLNSIAKAPLARALGIAPVHLSLPRNFAANEKAGVAILESIFRAAVQMGLPEYNVAVYDGTLLRRAQENPALYQDLIVRVWGFSAKFVDLSRQMQDHVISRIMNC